MIIEEISSLTVECTDDLDFNLEGFLGLKSKYVKNPGLTKGKTYQVVKTQTSAVGYVYSVGVYVADQIVNDLGVLEYYPQTQFKIKE